MVYDIAHIFLQTQADVQILELRKQPVQLVNEFSHVLNLEVVQGIQMRDVGELRELAGGLSCVYHFSNLQILEKGLQLV